MLRVLIVDDQEPMRRMVSKLLDGQKGFFVVAEACNGEDALRIADNIAPDLVLMDVQMPGMDGFETAAKMLKAMPGLRVAMASMDGNVEYDRMAQELGAIGFVKKSDLTAAALLSMLDRATARDS